MTGGGFGGCTVTLVERNSVDTLISKLKTKYFEKYHLDCICYQCTPSAGAGLIHDARSKLPLRSSKISCKQSDPAPASSDTSLAYNLLPILAGVVAVGLGIFFTNKRK